MAKATSIREALAKIDKESGIVAAEAEKVCRFTGGTSGLRSLASQNTCQSSPCSVGEPDSSGTLHREDGREPQRSEGMPVGRTVIER